MAMRLRSILFGLVLLTSCQEVVDRSFVAGEPRIVVEGLLTNERTGHKVKISWSFAGPNGTPTPVTGAAVRIIEGTTIYPLSENPLVPGEYITPEMRAVFGREYTLHINYSGQDFVARDSSVPVEPMTPLQYREVTGGVVLSVDKQGEDPNYIRHEIAWKNTPACQGGGCEGLVVFYDLKTIDVHEGTKPPKEDFVFPSGSTVIRRKYSVSPAYGSFLRAMMSETEWRGGAFDVERANLPTNLSNGAVGFFAVTTVTSDTTVVR
jgi:hypothetical protein